MTRGGGGMLNGGGGSLETITPVLIVHTAQFMI